MMSQMTFPASLKVPELHIRHVSSAYKKWDELPLLIKRAPSERYQCAGKRPTTMTKGESLVVFVLLLGVLAFAAAPAAAVSGTATYYTAPYTPSACYGFQDKGVMIAAASDVLWNNKAACGRRYQVRCTGATNQGVPMPCKSTSVVVTIVDYCPAGCQGTIDLSQEAFSAIADTNAGKIKIDYQQV